MTDRLLKVLCIAAVIGLIYNPTVGFLFMIPLAILADR